MTTLVEDTEEGLVVTVRVCESGLVRCACAVWSYKQYTCFKSLELLSCQPSLPDSWPDHMTS